jgi:hypothetical protein
VKTSNLGLFTSSGEKGDASSVASLTITTITGPGAVQPTAVLTDPIIMITE